MSKNLPSFITEDTDVIVPGDNQLKSIASLVEKLQALEVAVESAKENLKDLEEQLRKVDEMDIPEAMKEAGMTEFTLSDGAKVSVNTRYKVNISKERKPEICKWLRENQQEALVRSKVTVEFSKGDTKAALAFAQKVAKMGHTPIVTEDVNTTSVEATINELIVDQGKEVPEKLFGVFKLTKTKVKKARR